jgi:hypothetical protein
LDIKERYIARQSIDFILQFHSTILILSRSSGALSSGERPARLFELFEGRTTRPRIKTGSRVVSDEEQRSLQRK